LNNAGIRKRLHVSIPCGTQSAPTVTDETGATVTFTQSVAPSGADAWLGSTLANRAFLVGSGWPAGEIPRVVPILGTLSTAEKTEYFSTGRLPAWVMSGGSAVAVTAGSFVARTQYVIRSVGTTDFTLIGAASNAIGVQFSATGAGTGTGTASQAGALTASAFQVVGTVRDLTARGATDSIQGRLVGVTPIILDTQSGSVMKNPSQAFTAATSVQILGGAITGANKQRIVSITGNSSASTTLSVGTSTGGTQLVNAQAVNGDFDIGTFASRFLAANSSIWLTFAANTTAHVTINTSDL